MPGGARTQSERESHVTANAWLHGSKRAHALVPCGTARSPPRTTRIHTHTHTRTHTADPPMHHPPAAIRRSEEDAARAYDCTAVQAHGPDAKRNFPGEDISELPVTVGEKRKQCSSSRYIGVSWHKAQSSWNVSLMDPQTKRKLHVGYYASEEDAARAYDCAAVQACGPDAKRNFPAETISELPVTVGEEREQRGSSRYVGVSWQKAKSSWRVRLTDPQTKRRRHVGYYASEEDAAKAYDCAAVQAHGPGAPLAPAAGRVPEGNRRRGGQAGQGQEEG
jgi:hypothetical protein